MRTMLPVVLVIAAVIALCTTTVKYAPSMIERFTINSQSHHTSLE